MFQGGMAAFGFVVIACIALLWIALKDEDYDR